MFVLVTQQDNKAPSTVSGSVIVDLKDYYLKHGVSKHCTSYLLFKLLKTPQIHPFTYIYCLSCMLPDFVLLIQHVLVEIDMTYVHIIMIAANVYGALSIRAL